MSFLIEIVLVPFTTSCSPFPILTLEIFDLLSSLKISLSRVIWFVQPLSIIQSFEDWLVVTHVCCCICSFYFSWLWEHYLLPCNLNYLQPPHDLLSSIFVNLRYSCACKACITSVKVIVDKSFVFSKAAIDASYLSGTVTKIFSNFLNESGIWKLFSQQFYLVGNTQQFIWVFFNRLWLFHSLHLELPYQVQNFHASNLLVPFIFCFQVFPNFFGRL